VRARVCVRCMFRQILHSYWPTRHDSASLHPPEPLPPSFSHLLGLSARILLSSSALDADFMQFGTLKMIFLEQALTISAALRRIPPLLRLPVSPLNIPTTTTLSFPQDDHGPVSSLSSAQIHAYLSDQDSSIALAHRHKHTLTAYIHKHTHTHFLSRILSLPLSRAHKRTRAKTHQVTLHSTLHSALGHIQEALVDLAQSVAATTNTTRPAVSSRLARLGRPQPLSVHPVSDPSTITALKSSFAATSFFAAAAAAAPRSARGKRSAAYFSPSAREMQIPYSPGPDKDRRHMSAAPPPPTEAPPPTFPGVPQAARLQSHVGADRAVPERAGSDSQQYPAPHPAQQQQQNGLSATGREDRRYFDDGYGGGGVSGCTQMPVRGAARSGSGVGVVLRFARNLFTSPYSDLTCLPLGGRRCCRLPPPPPSGPARVSLRFFSRKARA
jgi:hypothetical protein